MPDGAARRISWRIAAVAATAGLAVLWAGFLWRLRLNWSGDSYYAYGYFVPLLAGVLIWQRWRLQPADAVRPGPAWTPLLAGCFVVAYAPFLLAVGLNPFWRLPQWGAGCCLVAATWLTILRLAGWRRAWRQAIPLLFLLTAIPWPMRLEQGVVQALTNAVVTVNTAALQLAGYPAESSGNLIQIGRCTVGVEEACSGIRSLQGLGMIALFVGALWRLRWNRWAGLLAVAAGVAFAVNLARAFALSLFVFHGGEAAYSAWHDRTGYLALVASMGALFVAVWWLGRKTPTEAAPRPDAAPPRPARALSTIVSVVFGLSCLLPEIGSAVWYRSATPRANELDIAVQWPTGGGMAASPLPIDERVRDVLKFDYGERVLLRQGNLATEAWHYGFEADAGARSVAAYVHSPSICMTANGSRLTAEHPPLEIDLGPFTLPFEHYTFQAPARSGARSVQVFWCMWDGGLNLADPGAGFRDAYLAAVLSRRRNVKRQVILLGIHDLDADEARARVTRLVRACVTPLLDDRPARLP